MSMRPDPATGPLTPFCSFVARLLELAAATALLFLMAFQFSDVIARYLLNRPIAGGQDIIGLALGLTIFLAMPVVTWRRAHITVPIFEKHFTGWARYSARLLALLATGAAFVAVGYGLFSRGKIGIAYQVVTEDLELRLGPIWYGLSALAFLAAVLLIDRLWRYLRDRGDPPEPSESRERIA